MSNPGNRRFPSSPQADPALVKALRDLPTAILSDNLAGLVGTSHLRPLHRGGRMAGTAVTVRVRPGDNLVLHRALDYVRPGDVLVVDGAGDTSQAVTGKIMMTYLERMGCAGFVLDGAMRGADEIGRKDFPVFARGVTPRGPYKNGPGEINVPVVIDGLAVAPGDVVVGDDDGIVAFAATDAPVLIERARAQLQKEMQNLQAIAEGRWDRTWIEPLEKKQGLL